MAECFSYCEGLRWHDPEFRLLLLDLVQEMDDTFISHMAEKAKTATAAKSDVVTP